MGFSRDPDGTITGINNEITSDKAKLIDNIPFDFNDKNKEKASGEIFEDLNNNVANLNFIDKQVNIINAANYGSVTRALLNSAKSNYKLLYNGYLCAKKGWTPDLTNDTCTEYGTTGTKATSATTATTATTSTSGTSATSATTGTGAPPIQEFSKYNYPSAVTTVGHRESFLGFGELEKTYSNDIITMPFFEGLVGFDENAMGGSNAMNAEKKLLDDLLDFNIKYQRYLHCNDQNLEGDQTCSSYEFSTCKEKNGSTDCLSTKIKNYLGTTGQIGTLESDITNAKNYLKASSLSQTDYESKYQQILRDQQYVVGLRNELDLKLIALHNPEKSVYSDYKTNFDSTIYSGILVSALATSIIYYIFTEL